MFSTVNMILMIFLIQKVLDIDTGFPNDWKCAMSLPGGNQAYGLPPASNPVSRSGSKLALPYDRIYSMQTSGHLNTLRTIRIRTSKRFQPNI